MEFWKSLWNIFISVLDPRLFLNKDILCINLSFDINCMLTWRSVLVFSSLSFCIIDVYLTSSFVHLELSICVLLMTGACTCVNITFYVVCWKNCFKFVSNYLSCSKIKMFNIIQFWSIFLFISTYSGLEDSLKCKKFI